MHIPSGFSVVINSQFGVISKSNEYFIKTKVNEELFVFMVAQVKTELFMTT